MKYTSEQMQVVINEWQTSGLSKKEFCRQRNISYHTFHYWCKRLISPRATGFTEMRVQSREPIRECEIMFPSGARMIFHGEPSVSWLRELLQ
jgi:hypothetical protein